MLTRVAVACVLAGSACGNADPAVRDSERRTDSARVEESAPSQAATIGSDPSKVLARLFLPDACVRGEPSAGVAWAIEGIMSDAVPVTRQSLSTLAARDSARLVARIARATDALPSDTGEADFRGLPVVVREGWRLVPHHGDTVIVAFVVRRLPMESSPLEEAFTIVAVPGARQGVREPLVERWYVREVGPEETSDPRELVAAFARHDGPFSLLFVREHASGQALEVVTRREGRWLLEWSGPIAHCD